MKTTPTPKSCSQKELTALNRHFLTKSLTFTCSLGTLTVTADENTVVGVTFTQQEQKNEEKDETPYTLLNEAREQLKEYSVGKRNVFTVPLTYRGTPFQMRVWDALRGIPFGTTVSYQDVANMITLPRAVRAVGSAIGKNPIGIIIPCHRVIASNGSLGGFGWGLEKKKYLLNLENKLSQKTLNKELENV